MIDQEDALAEDFIYSEDAINILWELPVLGNNAFGAVAFQRLFNFELANILAAPEFLGQPVEMDGDDIYFRDRYGNAGKASVSITHVRDHAALGHTGINIHAGTKAPQHAFSTELTDEQTEKFIKKVIEKFYSMNHDIFIATTKILTGGF